MIDLEKIEKFITSMRVKQYQKNPKASIYFYHKGLVKYVGVMLKGKMERYYYGLKTEDFEVR